MTPNTCLAFTSPLYMYVLCLFVKRLWALWNYINFMHYYCYYCFSKVCSLSMKSWHSRASLQQGHTDEDEDCGALETGGDEGHVRPRWLTAKMTNLRISIQFCHKQEHVDQPRSALEMCQCLMFWVRLIQVLTSLKPHPSELSSDCRAESLDSIFGFDLWEESEERTGGPCHFIGKSVFYLQLVQKRSEMLLSNLFSFWFICLCVLLFPHSAEVILTSFPLSSMWHNTTQRTLLKL